MTPQLTEFFEFLRFPSISTDSRHREDVRKCAGYLVEKFNRMGLKPELHETPGHPIIVARSEVKPGRPTVLIYGHYDVQTVAPLEAWTSPPFTPTIRDGALYARGASDDKGNAHALLAAAVDLAQENALPVEITVLMDGEEEIGGDSAPTWVEEQPDGAFDAAVVFDSGFVAAGRPAVEAGVRGVITALVTVQTGENDAHSGLYGGAGLNAAHVLTHLLGALMPAVDGRLPAALMEGVAEPSTVEQAAWGDLPSGDDELAIAGIRPIDASAVDEYYLRTTALPTFDVNAITCRDAARNRTIIPCEASAAISLRIVGGQDPERIWRAACDLMLAAAPSAATVTFELRGMSAGAAFDPDAPALRLAREGIEEATGMPCAVTRSGGAIPLVSALARRGVPTALTGCALPSDRIHAPDEHLVLEQYALGVAMARAILVRLGELESPR
jgi:acetylornithine deacetylase/succinyl-diaminopimelate desuccinylase-like protein